MLMIRGSFRQITTLQTVRLRKSRAIKCLEQPDVTYHGLELSPADIP